MRKLALISLAIVLALSMVSLAKADSLVYNQNQKGSIVVWPKVIVDYVPPFVHDTVMFLASDYTKAVNVQCYWMDSNQVFQDFQFWLSPNQPIVWLAGFGTGVFIWPFVLDPPVTFPPFWATEGALFCWAVNEDVTAPAAVNHLYGQAVILSGVLEVNEEINLDIEGAIAYNAYSFAAHSDPPYSGDPTKLLLNKVFYDACPKYLLSSFIPEDALGELDPSLTLIPCKQDLRQERTGTWTKAKFDIWNSNEVKFTGAYKCIKCFAEFWLDHEENNTGGVNCSKASCSGYARGLGPGFGSDKFSFWVLKTLGARFRVEGVQSDGVCNHSTIATGLMGFLMYGSDHDDLGNTWYTGTGLFGAGANLTGQFLWDPGSLPEQAKGN